VISVVTGLTLQFCNVKVYWDIRSWWQWNFRLCCQQWWPMLQRDMMTSTSAQKMEAAFLLKYFLLYVR